jgi:hypothetical protein
VKSVDNGAALLDERLPGWREVIDPDTLELADGCHCILGQLFGDYGKGIDILAVNPVRHGFVAGRTTYARLNAAWRRVLAR